MRLRRMLLITAAVCAVAFGSISFGLPGLSADGGRSCLQGFSAGACGRCGDGQCVKSCGENAQSCPIDCGGGVPAGGGR